MTSTIQNHQREGNSVENVRGGVTYTPRIDIWENDQELVLYADLPGVSAEDLEVRFENRELAIHGRVKPRSRDTGFVYSEYEVGDYYRSFRIGEAIAADRIEAELRHGVLVLHLPKAEAIKPRRIEVRTQ